MKFPQDSSHPRLNWPGFVGYLGLLFAGIAVVLGVQKIGTDLGYMTDRAFLSASEKFAGDEANVVFHVLLTLASVILLGTVMARLCRYVAQPPVIGEVIAGLMLGPSLLGAISPDAMHALLPTQEIDAKGAVASSLKMIAQLGVILYMFLVGLELNAAKLKDKAGAAIAISHASIVIPFALGAILSLWLYPLLSSDEVSFVSFSLFLGVAMSITAFPVLARILTDRNLQTTPIGIIALSCAAADDVTAWCLLALVVGVAKAEVSGAGVVLVGAMTFIVLMFFVARPMLVRYASFVDRKQGVMPAYAIASVYVLILGAAATTEWIGIHAIFGAFLLGLVIPSESSLASSFLLKLKEPVTVLLLPAFFAYTGMRTEIGLLNDGRQWFICFVIIVVATIGKFGGTLIAARYAGESWRDAGTLGILMNTRGLMELIVLNIGLDLGVISPTLFAMMVIMAIATTVATSPALQLLARDLVPIDGTAPIASDRVQ